MAFDCDVLFREHCSHFVTLLMLVIILCQEDFLPLPVCYWLSVDLLEHVQELDGPLRLGIYEVTIPYQVMMLLIWTPPHLKVSKLAANQISDNQPSPSQARRTPLLEGEKKNLQGCPVPPRLPASQRSLISSMWSPQVRIKLYKNRGVDVLSADQSCLKPLYAHCGS